MKALFDRRVKEELREAADWLEDRRDGLGWEFQQTVRRLIDLIESNPFQFGPAPGTRQQEQIRLALVGKFPYSICFYVIEEQDLVLILSGQHGHRRPDAWRHRLESFDPETGT